jgi:phosphomannomutase
MDGEGDEGRDHGRGGRQAASAAHQQPAEARDLDSEPPVQEHIVGLLARNGFDDIVVTLRFMPEEIQDYFGDGSDWGVRMRYSILAEGVRLNNLDDAGSWVLMLPDPDNPAFYVYAEADGNNGASTALVREYADLVRDLIEEER